jgi:hypothetical protein
LTIPLVSRWGGRSATVGLLTRISGRRTARRRRVATRAALRPRRTTRRRLVLLRWATWGRLVLLLTTVTTLLLAELTRARNLSGTLLVLGVVAGVNSTEDELENPKIRSEVDRWVGTSHLGRLVLVVGRAVHHASNDRIVVELAQELGG